MARSTVWGPGPIEGRGWSRYEVLAFHEVGIFTVETFANHANRFVTDRTQKKLQGQVSLGYLDLDRAGGSPQALVEDLQHRTANALAAPFGSDHDVEQVDVG